MSYSGSLLKTHQLTWERESEVLSGILEVIDLLFSLFRHPDRAERLRENDLPQVWIPLSTSAFQSARLAWHALQTAHYRQCFILTRAVLEDWLTAEDCIRHPKTIEALLYSTYRVPKFAEMRDRLPGNLKVLWGRTGSDDEPYGFLSSLAHPRQRARQSTLNSGGRLNIVPKYDEIRFALAANLLLQNVLLMLEILKRLADILATPASHECKYQDLKEVEPKGYKLFGALQDRLNEYETHS